MPSLKEQAVIYIIATAEAHSDIADDLLAIHRLSGAYTVASLHDIGKTTVVKISKKGFFSLSKVGDVKADMNFVEAQATKFIWHDNSVACKNPLTQHQSKVEEPDQATDKQDED